jgi:hypothetical protein
MINKKGQVFLMAAIIIAGIVISSAGLINYAKVGSDGEEFYDLTDEIDFETKRVIDYGVFNSGDIDMLIKGFLETYKDYIAREDVLFIYGDKNNVKSLHFDTNRNVGSAGIITGNGRQITINVFDSTSAFVTYTLSENLVKVEIRGIIYPFKLREGENFYFVIIKEDEDERFVAT